MSEIRIAKSEIQFSELGMPPAGGSATYRSIPRVPFSA